MDEGLKPGTKVVVRLLPPNITEEAFLESVPKEFRDAAVWFRFCKGKRRKTCEKPSTNARAYMNFCSPLKAFEFCRSFHGHSFIDEKGEIFKAVACLAPYPQVPRRNIPVDKKMNTMETDPLYLSFVASFDAGQSKPSLEVTEPSSLPTISPLVLEIQKRHQLKMERLAQLATKKKEKKSSKSKPVAILQKRGTPERSAASSRVAEPQRKPVSRASQTTATKRSSSRSPHPASHLLNTDEPSRVRRRERRSKNKKKENLEHRDIGKTTNRPETVQDSVGQKDRVTANESSAKRAEGLRAPLRSRDPPLSAVKDTHAPTMHRPVILIRKSPASSQQKANPQSVQNPSSQTTLDAPPSSGKSRHSGTGFPRRRRR